jgi:hypothetical protein
MGELRSWYRLICGGSRCDRRAAPVCSRYWSPIRLEAWAGITIITASYSSDIGGPHTGDVTDIGQI